MHVREGYINCYMHVNSQSNRSSQLDLACKETFKLVYHSIIPHKVREELICSFLICDRAYESSL